MKFREVLKRTREGRGLSQRDLAERAGVPIGSLRNYEQGIRLPTWVMVVKMARAMGVPTDTFAACEEAAPAPTRRRKASGRRAAS